MKFLFVLIGKIKILTLKTVYFPHELLHMLFLTPFRNLLSIFGLTVENRVFYKISLHENFAKLATQRFLCFAKMRDEFRSFVKLPRLRK